MKAMRLKRNDVRNLRQPLAAASYVGRLVPDRVYESLEHKDCVLNLQQIADLLPALLSESEDAADMKISSLRSKPQESDSVFTSWAN